MHFHIGIISSSNIRDYENLYEMMKERVAYIDQLKGFAILLVVMGHTYMYVLEIGNDIICNTIHSFHMPLFFFLSGIVMKSSVFDKSMAIAFLKKRFRSLMFPFFTVGILYTLYQGNPCSSLFEGNMKNGYWFLWTLFVYSVSLIAFNNCSHTLSRKIKVHPMCIDMVLIVFFMAVPQILIRCFANEEIPNILSLYNISKYICPFLLGGGDE